MEDASTDLSVSVFQICSNDSFENNSKKILDLLKVHDLTSVDLCVFPENALYININKKDKAPEISLEDPFFKEVQSLAQAHEVMIHLGSIPIYKKDGLYNATVIVDEKGNLTQPYDKIHLFVAKIGALDIDEGKSYVAGSQPFILELKGWKIGLSICFDLRFSELYSYYAKKGCELILVPAAFFRKTGVAHWETLLKARAVENQCYIIAPGQVGTHKSVKGDEIRKSYGQSLAVHPWGNLLVDLGTEGEAMETLVLQKEEVEKIRNSIFMKRKF